MITKISSAKQKLLQFLHVVRIGSGCLLTVTDTDMSRTSIGASLEFNQNFIKCFSYKCM